MFTYVCEFQSQNPFRFICQFVKVIISSLYLDVTNVQRATGYKVGQTEKFKLFLGSPRYVCYFMHLKITSGSVFENNYFRNDIYISYTYMAVRFFLEYKIYYENHFSLVQISITIHNNLYKIILFS